MSGKPPQRIGRYRLIRRVGRGGSGEVYLARLEAPAGVHRLAAVKVLLHTADDPRQHEALLAEARLGALLCHPNIAQILDAGVDDGLSWFAMEFVPGLSFHELLEIGSGQIPPWIAARIVAEACAAVHALHEATDEQGRALNVIHRDVTPHNLLVSWDGNVKLVDLGVAHSALRGSVTRTGVIKGKLGYMAPEQASGGAVDRRCDVFALGVQLWEALAGRRLFKQPNDSETLASIVRGDIPSLREHARVPAALSEVVAGALVVDRAARTPTALEMQRALDAALGEAGVAIGANEVAGFLAHLVPERVHEHISWLREAHDNGRGSAPAEGTAALPPSTTSISQRRKRRSDAPAWGAMLVVVAVATALLISRSQADRARPTQGEPAVPRASEPVSRIGVANSVVSDSAVMSAAALPPVHADPPAPARTAADAPKRPLKRAPPRTRPPTGVGTLYVSASPTWATISLDGKPAGTTPTVFTELPKGPHVIDALPLGKGPAVRQKVTIESGATARVGFDFEDRARDRE